MAITRLHVVIKDTSYFNNIAETCEVLMRRLHHFLLDVDVVMHCLVTSGVERCMLTALFEKKLNIAILFLCKTMLSKKPQIEHQKM